MRQSASMNVHESVLNVSASSSGLSSSWCSARMQRSKRTSRRFWMYITLLALCPPLLLLIQSTAENLFHHVLQVHMAGYYLRQKLASGITTIELALVKDHWFGGKPWLAETRNDTITEVKCPDLNIVVRVGREAVIRSQNSTLRDEHTLRASIHHFLDIDEEDLLLTDVVRILHRWEPGYRFKEPSIVRNNFHFLMSFYRHQSRPLGHVMYMPFVRNTDKWFQPPSVDFKDKNKAPALFVHRNCHDISKRKNFVSALMKTKLVVHSPGSCLHNIHMPAIDGTRDGGIPRSVSEAYKFVLVIENALCRDYISEKFVNAMDAGAVPIVRSFRDPVTNEQFPAYDEFAPRWKGRYMPNESYIDLGDFPNAESAAHYISFVAENEMLYKAYQWYRYLDNETLYKVQMETRNSGFYDQPAMFRSDDVDNQDSIQRCLCQAGKQIIEMDTTQRIEMMDVDEECRYGLSTWPEGWQRSGGWTD